MAGKVVRDASEKKVKLEEMPLEAYQAIGAALSASQSKGPFEEDMYQVFDPMKSVQKRNVIGGTSPQAVKKQLAEARRLLLEKPQIKS
jgi:argininosuccinate lyase